MALVVLLASAHANIPPKPVDYPGAWLTPDDYPAEALRDLTTGTTGVELRIGIEGTVVACVVTAKSGSDVLDETACRLLSQRARFQPARDRRGRAIASSFRQRIKWKIPTDAEELNYPTLTPVDAKATYVVTEEGLVEDCHELSVEGMPADLHFCQRLTSQVRFAPPLNAAHQPTRKLVTVRTITTIEDAPAKPLRPPN